MTYFTTVTWDDAPEVTIRRLLKNIDQMTPEIISELYEWVTKGTSMSFSNYYLPTISYMAATCFDAP